MKNIVFNKGHVTKSPNKNETLEEFVLNFTRLKKQQLSQISISIDDLFAFEGNDKIIASRYTDEEKKEFGEGGSKEFIKANTYIKIPRTLVAEATEIFFKEVVPENPTIEYRPFQPFVGEQIASIIEDERYAPVLKLQDRKKGVSVEKRHLNISVYVYSRVLDAFISLTPYVINCSTSVSGSGGNFTITLPPIVAEYDEDGNLLTPDNLSEVRQFPNAGSLASANYHAKGYMSTVEQRAPVQDEPLSTKRFSKSSEDKKFNVGKNDTNPNVVKRSNLYFNVALQAQDLVFIKFEALDIEVAGGFRKANMFETISINDFNGDFYDMIGLIDNVKESFNPTASSSVSVTGRDLSKLLLTDGAYFFPGTQQATGFKSEFFANSDVVKESPAFKRLLGEIQDVNLYTFQTIVYPMSFIFNKLSTAEVFPDRIFTGLADDNATDLKNFIDGQSTQPSKSGLPEKDTRRGVWKLVNMIIDTDDRVRNKVVVDSGVATHSGSIMSFIQRICQMPFIEFFTDTYGDRFYWIVRQPPFTQTAFLNNHRETIDEEEILSSDLDFGDSEAYSWYRLVPTKAYFGDTNMANYAFPAQFFPQYADIFGSRPQEVTSNYIETGSGLFSEIRNSFKQTLEEQRFIIESGALLPFARRGTITIPGRRTIKKGMCVYVSSTDELFYVDSVTNSYQVSQAGTQRTTVLSVSRGIVLSHAERYFNIVKFAEPSEQDVVERKVNYEVNQDNFDFLIKKRQLQ